MKCPCGSDQNYSECCQPFHEGNALPSTPEALMRSRYSAYALKNMDYLSETTDPQSLGLIDEDANKEWAEKANFQKLEIVKASETGTKGTVEFKAVYSFEGAEHLHHEISTFRKQAGRWYFKSGRVLETSP